MAFANDALRDKAKDLIQQGMKAKEVVEALGGQCTAQDVHQLKFHMKKAAGGGSVTRRKEKASAGEPKSDPAFKDAPPIVGILVAEETRLRNRVAALENLLEVYSEMKKGSPFRNAVEEEIERTNKRLDALADLLSGYDDAIPLKLKS